MKLELLCYIQKTINCVATLYAKQLKILNIVFLLELQING